MEDVPRVEAEAGAHHDAPSRSRSRRARPAARDPRGERARLTRGRGIVRGWRPVRSASGGRPRRLVDRHSAVRLRPEDATQLPAPCGPFSRSSAVPWLDIGSILALSSIASWGKLAPMIDELAGRRLDVDLLARELGNWRTSSASGPAYQGLADGLRMLIVDGRCRSGRSCPASGPSPTRCGCRAPRSPPRTPRCATTATSTRRRGARSTTALPRRRRRTRATRTPATVNLAAATIVRAGRGSRRTPSPKPPRQVTPYLHDIGIELTGVPRCVRRSPKDIARVGFPPTPTRSWSPPGALHAIGLILATYSQPGDRVLVEQPTYHGALSGDRHRRGPPGPGGDDPARAGNSTPSTPRCASWHRAWPT